ncbi:hypothetical protein BVZ35_00027B, partial [Haemophilus influenzae]
RRR